MKLLRSLLAPLLLVGACASPAPRSEPVGPGHVHHQTDAMPHRFEDAQKWAAIFDAPERDAWQEPDLVVKRIATRDDMTIADIGAGTGYFSVRLARAVPRGTILAVDIEPSLLAYLDARARKEGLSNVVTRLSTPDDPGLAELAGKIDLAFVCDTYHHIGDRVAYFSKVAQALAPHGRVVIIDFTLDSPRGPPRQHKIAPETVVAELAQAGLALVGRTALPDQYLLELERAAP